MAIPRGPSISSHSLGRAWVHDLPDKLAAAAAAGFAGIEMFYEDLIYHAASLHQVRVPTREQEIAAARDVRSLCTALGLHIICLQPLRNVEGRVEPAGRQKLKAETAQAIALAHALGTDLIGVASSLLPASATSSDPALLAADLAAVADAGAAAEPPVRFAYEALCFGTHVTAWQQSRDLVRRAARPNLGLCIDTFNLAGWDFADPARDGGVRPDGAARLQHSLAELVATVDSSEIFLLQVVDAERLAKPLDNRHPLHVDSQPARMSWSRAARLFYGETERGAYLPIRQVLDTLINSLGWRGWVSMELFSHSLEGPSYTVPLEHASRGMNSWRKMLVDIPQIIERRSDGNQDLERNMKGRPSKAVLRSRGVQTETHIPIYISRM